jgi:cell division protein FtsZ
MKIEHEKTLQIKVIGIGDFGCRVVDHLAKKRFRNIEFILVNTDIHSLLNSQAQTRVVIGDELLRGHGPSGDYNLGRAAAEESEEKLREITRNADIVFITAGLGGGTGTGALPVVARIARASGALTVGIVTLPFSFEGSTRIKLADRRIVELEKHLNTLIAVSGDRLAEKVGNDISLDQAFVFFADTLYKNIISISRLINVPGLINLDLSDIRTVLSSGSTGLMALGQASSEEQADLAAEAAIYNALGKINLTQADNILFCVTGSPNLSLFEVNKIASIVRSKTSPEVNLLFGAIIHPTREDMDLTILATSTKINIESSEQNGSDSGSGRIELHWQKSISTPQLKVFLCHSSGDKPVVRKLYQRLYSRRGIDPWLDEAKLLPGVRWDREVAKAVKESDVVVVCFSNDSITKEGYVQKEIKRALDIAEEKPEETIFIIPLKLEECEIPERLRQWQWVNYFEDGGFEMLITSLQKRAQTLGVQIE